MSEEEELDLGRREFILAGTTSLLSVQTGGLQIESQEDPHTEYQFRGVADLIGPLNARPVPGGPFFDRKIAFAYRYEATDSDQRFFITDDDSDWKELPMSPQTSLDQVRTENLTSFLNHTFARPGAPDDKNWEYNSADITSVGSEIELASTAPLIATQRGNYAAGSEAVPGMACRLTAIPTAGECFGGYFADADADGIPDIGMGFGSDSTADFVFVAKQGTIHRVHQPDWNGEPVEDRPLVVHHPRICRFPHLFYGGGPIKWRLLEHTTINGKPRSQLKTVHVETPKSLADAGTPFDDGPAINQPNLPPAFSSVGLTGANLRANAVHYNLGDSHAENRINGEHFTGITVSSTGWTPLVTWEKRDGWEPVNVEPLTVLVAPRTNDVKLELQLDSTISGTTFNRPTNTSTDETAVHVGVGGTLDALGERRWPGYATAGQANQPGDVEVEDLSFNLPAGKRVTLAAQGVGGDATAYGVVAWEEYF